MDQKLLQNNNKKNLCIETIETPPDTHWEAWSFMLNTNINTTSSQASNSTSYNINKLENKIYF